MSRSNSVNYTAAGTDFQIATADSDPFDANDVQKLGKAVDDHDHSSTRGLGARRIQTGTAPAAAGEARVNAEDLQWFGTALQTAVRLADAQTLTGRKTFSHADGIALSAAASKIVPGATSLALRNNADNADNLLVSDAGVVTVRNGLSATAGDITASGASNGVLGQAFVRAVADSAYLQVGGTNPAAAGAIRLRNAADIRWRNNAGTGDRRLTLNAGDSFVLHNSAVETLVVTDSGNIYGVAGSTGMTDGFIWIPAAAGAPTGTPTAATGGGRAFYYDSTNNRIYVYNGSWRFVAVA